MKITDKSSSEKGSALMVSLVLIFMMSIMGVSVMRSASMEKKIVDNSIYKEMTLQLADSATELAIADTAKMEQAWRDAGVERSYGVAELQDAHVTMKATVRYVDTGLAMGSSTSLFNALHFETIGEAEIQGVQAKSVVKQGSYRLAPSMN